MIQSGRSLRAMSCRLFSHWYGRRVQEESRFVAVCFISCYSLAFVILSARLNLLRSGSINHRHGSFPSARVRTFLRVHTLIIIMSVEWVHNEGFSLRKEGGSQDGKRGVAKKVFRPHGGRQLMLDEFCICLSVH